MATNDKTGPDGEAVEGSWSPKRPTKTASAKKGRNGSPAPDPEVLAGEIDKTREELAETLDAIADKVSPKRVAGRTAKAAKEGAGDAVDSVKETAHSAAEAVRSGVAKAKAKDKVSPDDPQAGVPLAAAEVPVEVAPTPGALADTAAVPVVPVGAEEPVRTTTLPPAAPSRAPMYAGAATAALVVLFLLRRRRR